jgi:hypothetical protein
MKDSPNAKRVFAEGATFGVIAGVIFLAAEMLVAGASGAPLAPLRSAASVVLGLHAVDSFLGTTYLAGLAVHLVLSGLVGLGYAEIEAHLPREGRRRYGVQVGVAMAYAAFVWLVAIDFVAHVFFPWLVTLAPLADLIGCAVFLGIPLGVTFAAAERRLPQISPRPHAV